MIDIENIELTFLSLDEYQVIRSAMIEPYSNMPNSFWTEDALRFCVSCKLH